LVFPGQNLPLPCRLFPFDPSPQALPTCIPDCHLVRTVIPCLPSNDSLGDFHDRTSQVLASFASMVSKSYCSEAIVATNCHPRKLFSPHVHSRQATLHVAHDSVHHIAGSYLIRTRRGFHTHGVLNFVAQASSLRGNRVVCSMPLERARNP